jgi:purine nucleosidase
MTCRPRSLFFLSSLTLAVLALSVAPRGFAQARAPVNLIIDTDIGNDVDDALALGVAHALESRGLCRLLAVTLTNPDPLAGEFVSAIDTFYGRGDIPIGVNPSAPAPGKSRFLKLAAARDEHGRLRYPHSFDPAKALSALAVLRRTLAAADDGSVVMVQIGFFTNLVKLLDSPPDEFSPLPGMELIRRKVKFLSLMAGAFSPEYEGKHFLEFNVRGDLPASAAVAVQWPTPMVWSGFEIGEAVTFPAQAVDHDFAYVAHHPLQEAYQLYHPTPHERPCFDLTATLYAIWPDRGYFDLSGPGQVTVLPDAFTKFTPQKDGRDRYLKVTPDQIIRLRQLFAALCTEPPSR